MGAMKYGYLIIKSHSHSRSFAFIDDGSQGFQQSFNISPFYIA
jgi:hypothetical protein